MRDIVTGLRAGSAYSCSCLAQDRARSRVRSGLQTVCMYTVCICVGIGVDCRLQARPGADRRLEGPRPGTLCGRAITGKLAMPCLRGQPRPPPSRGAVCIGSLCGLCEAVQGCARQASARCAMLCEADVGGAGCNRNQPRGVRARSSSFGGEAPETCDLLRGWSVQDAAQVTKRKNLLLRYTSVCLQAAGGNNVES